LTKSVSLFFLEQVIIISIKKAVHMHAKQITHKKAVYEIAKKYLFSREVHSWNMDMLARESGITKRTLYKIIPSKEELIKEIVFETLKETQNRVSDIIKLGNNYLETVELLAETYSHIHEKMTSESLGKIMKLYPSIEKMVIERKDELSDEFIRFFQRGIDEGHLKKDLTPEQIIEILQALIIYYLQASDSSETFISKLTSSYKLILHGFKAE